jgi:hypothetical protein
MKGNPAVPGGLLKRKRMGQHTSMVGGHVGFFLDLACALGVSVGAFVCDGRVGPAPKQPPGRPSKQPAAAPPVEAKPTKARKWKS